MNNYLDESKPELKEGETLCDGCWKVGKRGEMEGWYFVNFKHLSPTWVCADCRPKLVEKLNTLQAHGL